MNVERIKSVNLEEGVEMLGFPKEDYMPLKDYESWRVAVLKSCENTKCENINWMQKHLFTDEVFVLLDGHCTLLVAGEGEAPENFKAIEMIPHKIYNIKKGYWHNHVLDENGEVLIVENQNTTDDNSPVYSLNETEINQLRKCVDKHREISVERVKNGK